MNPLHRSRTNPTTPLMNRILRRPLLLLSFLGLTAGASYAATEENLKTNFTALPGGQLVVDVDSSAIEVRTHPAQEIDVEIHRRVSMRTEAREKQWLEDRPVVITREGNTLRIRARKSGASVGWSWSAGTQSIDSRFVVTVPVEFAADLSTSGGSIGVKGLHGLLKANTAGGSLRFEETQGELKGNTSGGGIQLSGCTGNLRVETSGGGIKSEGGAGSLHADTSGGSIEVRRFGGPAKVRTAGGGIRLEGVAGDLHGETSGGSIHAVIAAPVPGAVRLSTSGGGIEVRTPKSAAFDLKAETSAGRVTCDLPIQSSDKPNRSHLAGPVNGGGPKMQLETSAGGIHIRAND